MANSSHVEETIKAYILKEFLPDEDPAQLLTSTPLLTSGVLDSIATLQLVSFLEEEFSVSIEAHEADAEYLDTIERIGQLIASKSAE